jgi:hypothetical protein
MQRKHDKKLNRKQGLTTPRGTDKGVRNGIAVVESAAINGSRAVSSASLASLEMIGLDAMIGHSDMLGRDWHAGEYLTQDWT